jgi:hypothetical protein
MTSFVCIVGKTCSGLIVHHGYHCANWATIAQKPNQKHTNKLINMMMITRHRVIGRGGTHE